MTTGSPRKKQCGLFTQNEVAVLGTLFENRKKYNSLYTEGYTAPGWCRCRDIGGIRDSHHSLTLRRLSAKGLVDAMCLRSKRAVEKQLKGYRISSSGEQLWLEYLAFLNAPGLPLSHVSGVATNHSHTH